MYLQPVRNRRGKYFWRLKGENHETMAHSEPYSRWRNCRETLQRVAAECDLRIDWSKVPARLLRSGVPLLPRR